MLYCSGVDVKTAQRLLGHADVQTTLRIYTYLSAMRCGDAVADVKKHFAKIVGKSVGKSEDFAQ